MQYSMTILGDFETRESFDSVHELCRSRGEHECNADTGRYLRVILSDGERSFEVQYDSSFAGIGQIATM